MVARDLEGRGFSVLQARDGVEGWDAFRRNPPALVVTDLRMPRSDGIDLLRRIRSVSKVPVILLTAYGDVPTAVTAIKSGAQEFLAFPEDLHRLVERVSELTRAPLEDGPPLNELFVGRSRAIEAVRSRIQALAPLDVPVLIIGDPGTGRDLAAHALHRLGPHSQSPFVKIAPTGQGARLPPEPSTVYLDEIGQLSPQNQRHWEELFLSRARALEQHLNRLFASTSDDLGALSRRGHFSSILAERLLRFSVVLPPLGERLEDLGDLVPHLSERIGRELGRGPVRFEGQALRLLETQRWPGNVRDLSETLEKLVAFSSSGVVTPDHVRQVLAESPNSVSRLRSRKIQQQREELVKLLEECEGNLAEVARRLDLSRGAVIYRAQKYGLLPRRR